jgi:hypothetical protein
LRNLAIFLLFITLVAQAFSVDKDSARKKHTSHGYLVDIACATDRASKLSSLGLKHTKKCLQMPACEHSGYGLLTADQKVLKFDSKGNEQAKRLIAVSKREKNWTVTVTGPQQGDTIQVSRIELK